MRIGIILPAFCLAAIFIPAAVPASGAAETVVKVADDASLRAALHGARAGTRIAIAPGRYRPGIWVENLHGTAERPIVIEGADPTRPPLFEGGREAWHLSNCSHVTLRNVAVRGQSGNGINVDDGGTFDTPSHHVVLEAIRVTDIGPRGNHDGIKLSGVVDFVVRRCHIEGWGGQAVDMVGCHRGLIEECTFQGKDGFTATAGPQAKGGSSQITVRRCLFRDAGSRAMQAGGSTGLQFFRPQGARYEAKDITVEGCVFIGSDAAVAFVGVDGAVFRYNTIYRPRRWILRILQETTEPGFVPCRNVRFEHNLIVFRHSEVRAPVNIGPNTAPKSFVFANNFWYCEDRPAASRVPLPTAERGGVYGVDPRLAAPAEGLFQPREPRASGFGATACPQPGDAALFRGSGQGAPGPRYQQTDAGGIRPF